MILEGIAHVFGDHINTDYIISGKHKTRFTNVKEMTQFIMEDIRPGFYKEIQPGDFIVGGINYGCGSSREAAAIVTKAAGISAVLAKNFARIHFRNLINVGLPALSLDTSTIKEGDRLRVDLAKGTIENLTRGEVLTSQPLPQFMQRILDAGGMVKYFAKHRAFNM